MTPAESEQSRTRNTINKRKSRMAKKGLLPDDAAEDAPGNEKTQKRSHSAASSSQLISTALPDLGHILGLPSLSSADLDSSAADPPTDVAAIQGSILSKEMDHQSTLAKVVGQLSASIASRDAEIAGLQSAAIDALAMKEKALKKHIAMRQAHEGQTKEISRLANEAMTSNDALMENKANTKATLDSIELSAEERVTTIQANYKKMMAMIHSFNQYIAPNSDGTHVLEQLQSMMTFQQDNGVDIAEWPVTAAYVVAWTDIRSKVNNNVDQLTKLITPPKKEESKLSNYTQGYVRVDAASEIICELSGWLCALRDPECTSLQRSTISWYLRTTLLAQFVNEHEVTYNTKRGTKKVDVFAKECNKPVTSFAMHRDIIHLCALHCHLRLLLWRNLHPFGAAATATFTDFTTGIYRLIVDRECDTDNALRKSDPASDEVKKIINKDQMEMGRHWCIFTSMLDAASTLPAIHAKLMVARCQHPDTTITALRTHLLSALAKKDQQPTWFNEAIEIVGMNVKTATSSGAAEWCLREAPSEKIWALLKQIVEAKEEDTNGSAAKALYMKIKKSRLECTLRLPF